MSTGDEQRQPSPEGEEFGQEMGRLDSFLRKLFRANSSGNSGADNESSAPKPSPDSADFVDQEESDLTFLEPGTKIGRFKIVGLIGYGGFGVVYHAVDEAAGQAVALKLPRPDRMNSAQVLKRFYREARLARDLKHRSIVEVLETSLEGEHFYIASAYQHGMNLKDWLERNDKPLTVELVVDWGIDLADALQYAFLNGIVHRDLKPTNILIVQEQTKKGDEDEAAIPDLIPRITDFGLAYSVNDPISSTSASGMLIGTPGYMAPEQVLTGMNRVDIRADIYALGLIMAEMLAGERIRKFEHLMGFVVHLTKNDPSRDLDLLKKKLPVDLYCILLKAIDVEPERRYQTPGELLEDLRRFQRREPILARPMTRRERAARFVRRKPYQAALIMLSCLFLGYFLVNRLAQQRELGLVNIELVSANDSLTKTNDDLQKTLIKLQSTEKKLIRKNYNSKMLLAYSEFRDGHIEATQDILDETRRMKYNSGEPLAEFSWRYLGKLASEKHSGHRAAEFDTYLPEPYGTQFRQLYEKNRELIDSRGLLFGEMDVNAQFVYVRSGFQQILLQPKPLLKYITDPITSAMKTSDGIQTSTEQPTVLVAPATRHRVQLRAAVVPVKDRASLGREFARNIERKPTGELFMPFNFEYFMPVFSMNGQVVVGLCAFEIQGEKSLEWVGYDLQSAEPFDLGIIFKPSLGKKWTFPTPSIGQNGRGILCYDEASKVIFIYDRQTNRKTIVLNWNMPIGEGDPKTIALDEINQRFIVGDSANRIRAWKIGEKQPFAEFPNRIATLSSIGLLPGGLVNGRIAYSDRVWAWDPEHKPRQDQRFKMAREVWSLTFDPTGEFLVASGDDHLTHIWNLKTGAEKILEKHESMVSSGRFSADGTRFAACDFSGWLKIWNTADWSLVSRQRIANERLRSLAWGADNQTLVAVGNGKSAWGWFPGDVQVRPLPVDDISHDIIYLKKKGLFVVSQQGMPSALRFLASPGLEVVKNLPTNRRPMRLALSPDESLIVVGFSEGGFDVYDTSTYELVKSVGTENMAGTVKTLAFLKDGKNLIVSGGDSRLTIYETETWEPIGTIMDHASQVNAMAVSPDGRFLATGDMAGQIIVRQTNP